MSYYLDEEKEVLIDLAGVNALWTQDSGECRVSTTGEREYILKEKELEALSEEFNALFPYFHRVSETIYINVLNAQDFLATKSALDEPQPPYLISFVAGSGVNFFSLDDFNECATMIMRKEAVKPSVHQKAKASNNPSPH